MTMTDPAGLNLRDLQAEPITGDEMREYIRREPDLLAEILAAPTERAALEIVARLFARILVRAVLRG